MNAEEDDEPTEDDEDDDVNCPADAEERPALLPPELGTRASSMEDGPMPVTPPAPKPTPETAAALAAAEAAIPDIPAIVAAAGAGVKARPEPMTPRDWSADTTAALRAPERRLPVTAGFVEDRPELPDEATARFMKPEAEEPPAEDDDEEEEEEGREEGAGMGVGAFVTEMLVKVSMCTGEGGVRPWLSADAPLAPPPPPPPPPTPLPLPPLERVGTFSGVALEMYTSGASEDDELLPSPPAPAPPAPEPAPTPTPPAPTPPSPL